MITTPLLLALGLASTSSAQRAGSIEKVGSTLVSAMMMFLGNEEKVYIMDKSEGNAAKINGHPAWGSVYDLTSNMATTMDFKSNAFCASGHHLPNGSYATFGGNGAIGPAGSPLNQPYDPTYGDLDGTKGIRIINPCKTTDNFADSHCQWYDNPRVLSMQKKRWYSTAEALDDGTIVLIGGFVNGGYINRNYPNTDPEFEGGAAESTFEFYPSRGPATRMQFMVDTSGLNSYAHAFLMPSGKMFVQANISTIMWDYNENIETKLPPMPKGIARVYPASGAVAMLPLTPANSYTPTIIFCGGQHMPDYAWGDYSFPYVNTWDVPASNDCQRITPEPLDGSDPVYIQDDDMLETRTMGQFIILPDGKMLMVNGGLNGTAGYAQATKASPGGLATMPYGESLAAGPVLTPAIYDPLAPQGQRWSNEGLGTSTIPRLYHSSAILLPDGSVLIAGSNPNIDVNLTTIYPTTYQAEIFYPPYFSATVRPRPSGVPTKLTYGGSYFNITIPAGSYNSSANDAAASTTVVLQRGGFTTHGMNMGQRLLQLNNTFTVNEDGSYILHTSQVPPNPALLTPGPVLVFVLINGIPSNGTLAIIGNGKVGKQPTAAVAALPASVLASSSAGSSSSSGSGTGSGNVPSSTSGTSRSTVVLIGAIVGGVVAVGILGALIACCLARRRRSNAAVPAPAVGYVPRGSDGSSERAFAAANVPGSPAMRSDPNTFVSLQDNHSTAGLMHGGSASLAAPQQEQWSQYASGPPTPASEGYDGYYSQAPQQQGQAGRQKRTY